MLTDAELRQAIEALVIVENRGDAEDFQYLLNQATASTPSADPFGNASIGVSIQAGLLARRLSGLLGVPIVRCEQAAADVLAPQRELAVYNAILAYAAELAGGGKSPKVENISAFADDAPTPAVRIVVDDLEAVA